VIVHHAPIAIARSGAQTLSWVLRSRHRSIRAQRHCVQWGWGVHGDGTKQSTATRTVCLLARRRL